MLYYNASSQSDRGVRAQSLAKMLVKAPQYVVGRGSTTSVHTRPPRMLSSCGCRILRPAISVLLHNTSTSIHSNPLLSAAFKPPLISHIIDVCFAARRSHPLAAHLTEQDRSLLASAAKASQLASDRCLAQDTHFPIPHLDREIILHTRASVVGSEVSHLGRLQRLGKITRGMWNESTWCASFTCSTGRDTGGSFAPDFERVC